LPSSGSCLLGDPARLVFRSTGVLKGCKAGCMSAPLGRLPHPRADQGGHLTMTVAFVEQNLAEPHRPPRSTTAARSAGPFRASVPRRGGASTSLPGRPRRASHREPSPYRVARGASGTQSRSGERAVARGKRKCAKSAPPGGKPSLDVLADPRRARLARFLKRRIWIEISPFFIFDGLPRPRKAPIFLVRNQQRGFLYATDFSHFA
jgi:hypothetical protein